MLPFTFVLKVHAQPTMMRVAETIAVQSGAASDAAFTLVVGSEAWADFSKAVPFALVLPLGGATALATGR